MADDCPSISAHDYMHVSLLNVNALRNEKAAKKRARQARQREVNTSFPCQAPQSGLIAKGFGTSVASNCLWNGDLRSQQTGVL